MRYALHKLAAFRELTWMERGLLIRALVLLPVMSAALRWLGFRRLQSLLDAGSHRLAPASLQPQFTDTVRATARLVAAAGRHGPYQASCLPRSLTLAWLLQRQVIAAELRIGVRKVAGRFEAHAWVEHQGVPLIDDYEVGRRYAPFDQLEQVRGAASR
jgi:hypothetical protein